MNRHVCVVFLLILAMTAYATSADAQASPCCCRVIISGYTMTCGGLFIPEASVELTGQLRDKGGLTPYMVHSDSTGAFGFVDLVPLGNYFGNQLLAWSIIPVGPQSVLYYMGTSTYFDAHCFVAGQTIAVSIDIPLWIM